MFKSSCTRTWMHCHLQTHELELCKVEIPNYYSYQSDHHENGARRNRSPRASHTMEELLCSEHELKNSARKKKTQNSRCRHEHLLLSLFEPRPVICPVHFSSTYIQGYAVGLCHSSAFRNSTMDLYINSIGRGIQCNSLLLHTAM